MSPLALGLVFIGFCIGVLLSTIIFTCFFWRSK